MAGAALVVGMEGVMANAKDGIALVTRGCDLGDRHGCELLSLEYDEGDYLPHDPITATRYLDRACDRALGSACFKLMERYGVARAAEAMTYARRACQMGNGEACAVLASGSRTGTGVTASDAEYERWSTEACRMGFTQACGVLIERGKRLPVPTDMAQRIYQQACAANVAGACAHGKTTP